MTNWHFRGVYSFFTIQFAKTQGLKISAVNVLSTVHMKGEEKERVYEKKQNQIRRYETGGGKES